MWWWWKWNKWLCDTLVSLLTTEQLHTAMLNTKVRDHDDREAALRKQWDDAYNVEQQLMMERGYEKAPSD